VLPAGQGCGSRIKPSRHIRRQPVSADRVATDKAGVRSLATSASSSSRQADRYGEAITASEDAAAICRATGSRQGQASALRNLGRLPLGLTGIGAVSPSASGFGPGRENNRTALTGSGPVRVVLSRRPSRQEAARAARRPETEHSRCLRRNEYRAICRRRVNTDADKSHGIRVPGLIRAEEQAPGFDAMRH